MQKKIAEDRTVVEILSEHMQIGEPASVKNAEIIRKIIHTYERILMAQPKPASPEEIELKELRILTKGLNLRKTTTEAMPRNGE